MKRALVALLLLSSGIASAQGAPSTVSFVARLANNGVPVSGQHDFVLALFDGATGGASLWSETRLAVQVPMDGLQYFDLGSVTTLDASVFAGTKKYLEITLDGVVSNPRILIESVPYAIRAGVASDADKLQSHASTDFQMALQNGCAAGSSIQTISQTGVPTCQNTTYTNGSGLLLSSNQFSVDKTQIQARISMACTAGNYMFAVAADGTPMCSPDLNSVYTNGTGLLLGGNQFSVDFTTTQHAIGACAAGSTLNKVDAAGNPTCDNTTYTAAASGGLSLAANAFSVDPTLIQRRVTGTCGVGAAISTIAQDGTVTCSGPFTPGSGRVDTGENRNNVAYGDLATVGPSATVAIPASGNALITVTAQISPTGFNTGFVSFSGGGIAAADNQALVIPSGAGGMQASATFRVTGITTGSQTITAKYRSSGNTTFANRHIIVVPLP